MNEIEVLKLEDGAWYYAGTVNPPPKQKRIRTLKEWIRAHGEDGKTYRLTGWLTPAIDCKETKRMELFERKVPPKPKKKSKPEPVEERVVGSME